MLGGGVVTGRPVVETLVNNSGGALETVTYVREVTQAAPETLGADFVNAQRYNAALAPAALWDPWGDETPTRSEAHDAYTAQLAGFSALGRLRFPQVAIDLPIFHDATKGPLAKGVGHMYGTSLPVGGPDTHAVLAGHTGLRGRTMFDRLPEVTTGQEFYLDVAGRTLTYVTLVTCYTPPGQHKQRLLVRGVRVPDAAVATASTTTTTTVVPVTADLGVQEWMWPRIAVAGGAAAFVGVMPVVWGFSDRRQRDRLRRSTPSATSPAAHPAAQPTSQPAGGVP